MCVTDPREAYDDLLVKREEVTMDADEFASLQESEAAQSGWVAIGVVLDARKRVLLAYNSDDESWLLPGGTVQASESLREGLIREVHEETGVSAVPGRPRALGEFVCHHDGETDGFRTVVCDADPESREIGDDLGEPGEPIEKARWFTDLPENTFEREFAVEVVARCRTKHE